MILITLSSMILAYFLGSISNAILICKIANRIDPRKYGSQNPGVTNVFRIGGYKLASIVALLDFLKGAIPIWLGTYFQINPSYLMLISISVCIGHMYPVFFQFCGGKGVTTTFGSITAINFYLSIIIISTWILFILLFRYVSLGSILVAIMIPLYTWCMDSQHFYYTIMLSFLIIIRHSSNIKRLWKHQENHIWRNR